MNIAVLAGGLSTERDVSIISGAKVASALREKGHKVILLDVFMGYECDDCDPKTLYENGYDFSKNAVLSEQVPDIEKIKGMRADKSDCYFGQNVIELCKYADICFLALHGGVGENGQLQAAFDILGIRYTGTGYLGSAISMDKGISKSVLINSNIKTPKGRLFAKEDIQNGEVDGYNDFPCVVKPCSGGSSVGVSIVQTKEEFFSAMAKSFEYESSVLVEQYIKGREFSIGVLDGKALPVIEIIPKEGFYDYVNKYQSGKTLEVCPAELDKKTTELLQKEAERGFEALKLSAYGRLDFLLDESGEIYCLEANTLPGMTPISLLPQEAAAQGIDYPSLCDKIVELSLQKYR